MPSITEIRKQFPQYADVPDEQLVIGLHRTFYKDMPFADFHKKIQYDNAPNPTEGMGGMQKFNAGVGKAMTDMGRGAAQLFGGGPSASDVDETKRLDAPLMKTGAGVAGNVAGTITALTPLAVVPGANTVAGAGALGMLAGSLQPTRDAGERLWNQGMGAVLGGGTQALAGPGARMVGDWAGRRQANLAAQEGKDAVLNQTLREGKEAGFMLPPSESGQGGVRGWINRRLEGIGGKAAIGQELQIRNSAVADDLARGEAGLAPNQAMSPDNLKAARQTISGPYREVEALPKPTVTYGFGSNTRTAPAPGAPAAEQLLEDLRQARFEANRNWKWYGRNPDPLVQDKAIAFTKQAADLEKQIESMAQNAGRPELVDSLRASRTALAKNYNVENALNRGSGSIDPSVIGRLYDAKAPLSDGLKTIGAFQQAYPQYLSREATRVPTPGVGKTEALAGALLATSGGGAAGAPGLLAGGLPLLGGPTRAMILSKPYQALMANPSNGGMTSSLQALSNPETQRRVALLARALAIPAAAQE